MFINVLKIEIQQMQKPVSITQETPREVGLVSFLTTYTIYTIARPACKLQAYINMSVYDLHQLPYPPVPSYIQRRKLSVDTLIILSFSLAPSL
jgi:hypothetical protein